ncbi:AsmA family protein [Reyranella sp. MMS21-HV4-11]|uniref:AsmA family protein n=1 Tax=Reyranella humidisoli TaxID=2849149 RepID=A0ABS6IHT9_9HYPH|nr:AsmA family protein [Reyranella sp. MMS21-HV4-11]MBU8874152.1 AsmA family protein [Reyranella sp. MMS21-HV4-11]
MTPTTRKRLLIGGGGIVALLVALVVAAPALIDINSYKPLIVSQVKTATGRDLVIDGPISLSLLPTPTVSVTGVKFFNAAGSKNANMVEVKSVTVQPSLLALLVGRIEVGEVTLVEPKIVLEINAAGKPNWEFAPSVAEAKPAAAKPSSPRPLSLGRLTIDNGTLIFSDSKAGLSVVGEKANFSASVGSIDGPYTLAGGATVNGAPLKLDLAVGARGANGHSADVTLQAGGGKLGFKGTLSELGAAAKVSGIASVSADSLTTFVGTLVKLSGQPEPPLPPLLAGKFTFDGAIDVSQTAFAARDFKMALGQDSGSGTLAVTLKPKLGVEGKLSVPKLDLDRWLAALQQPSSPATSPAPQAAPAAPGNTNASGGGFFGDLNAKLAFELGEVIYNKQPVRNVALELEAKGGAVAVPKLAATLPGDMVLQAQSTLTGDAARPGVTGQFSLVGPKLRETLAWLAVDVSSVPPSKLQRLSLRGRMSSTGGNVQVSDAVFELDDLKGSGGVTVTFGVPLSIVTSVSLDTLDLDSFLVKTPAQQKPATPSSAATGPASAPAVVGPSVGLKARVARLIYNKETIQGVDVDVALQGSTLRLNDIKISNLGGGRLAVRGSVANYSAPMPRPDIAFNFEAPDLSRVLKVAGTTAPSDLGAVSASGGIAGTIEQLTLRDVAINMAGQSVKATGTLSLPGASKGMPQSAAYKGNLVLNGQALDGSIDARLTGRTTVNADLRATTLDLDRIGGSGGGGAPARPAGRGQAAAAKPIDTAPLRSIDGSLKLAAGTLISAPMRIGNADLAATLKDGVLTVQHFKGSLFGGSLALAGTVNATQPALSIDFRGDANNIFLGQMLRSTSGTNEFGSAVKVTVDGKLNANGITLRGGGTTSDQIRASMAGGAQLGGHIFIGADKALQMLGSMAAGAASTVIDQTLGNMLGAIGQRGMSPTSMLNAISLVLNRFVNHDSPISGHVDIAGGVLTDRGLAVQGNRATARISTRTNLGASTTDTTVSFYIAEDGSAPYLITTARGAMSSPSLNVSRGTAKDPPGMISTLPGVQQLEQVPRSLIPNIPIPIPNIFGR